jgi:hypothetical protein
MISRTMRDMAGRPYILISTNLAKALRDFLPGVNLDIRGPKTYHRDGSGENNWYLYDADIGGVSLHDCIWAVCGGLGVNGDDLHLILTMPQDVRAALIAAWKVSGARRPIPQDALRSAAAAARG